MSPDRSRGRSSGPGATSRRTAREITYVHANDAAHHTLDDTVKDVIERLGSRARGLVLTDESDARIYERRVAAVLSVVPSPVVGRILDELGGDSTRARALHERVAAVQVIVTSASYWGRPR